MPLYDYQCPENGRTVEVFHSMRETIETWGELCRRAEIDPGDTPPETAVQRLVSTPGINSPTGDSQLKNMGFTKLVRRDKGVYENVTATGTEKKYMKADDPSSMPHLHKKMSD